jgi:hypothetical protein
MAILANRIAPNFADRYLAKNGYSGQMKPAQKSADAPNNLFEPVPGPYAARGTFGRESRRASWEMFTSEHRYVALAAAVIGLYGLHRAAKRLGL